jgi:hypothetical protein
MRMVPRLGSIFGNETAKGIIVQKNPKGLKCKKVGHNSSGNNKRWWH